MRGALTDAAVGDGVLAQVDALGLVQLRELLVGLEGAVVVVADFDQGMLRALGTWPGRWDCSCGRCAGASSLPLNSSGERTSTRFLVPIASTTSSRKARMAVSCGLAR